MTQMDADDCKNAQIPFLKRAQLCCFHLRPSAFICVHLRKAVHNFREAVSVNPHISMKIVKLLLFVGLCAPNVAAMGQGLDPALLLKPATDAWPSYAGDYSQRRYSTLTQIDT